MAKKPDATTPDSAAPAPSPAAPAKRAAKTKRPLIPTVLQAKAGTGSERGPELPLTPKPVKAQSKAAAAPDTKEDGNLKNSTRATTVYLLPNELKRLRMLSLQHDKSLHTLILDGIDRVLADLGEAPLSRYKGA